MLVALRYRDLDLYNKFLASVLTDEKYDYLLTLPIHSFTYEKIEELKEKIRNKEEEIDVLASKSEKEIWMDELDEFKEVYTKRINNFFNYINSIPNFYYTLKWGNKQVIIKIISCLFIKG